MWIGRGYRNCLDLQRLIMTKAQNPSGTAKDLAMLCRAYCELEETKRIIRMKPLPKPVDVSLPKPKPLQIVDAQFSEAPPS